MARWRSVASFFSVGSALGWKVKNGDAAGREVEKELGILRASTRRSHASSTANALDLSLSLSVSTGRLEEMDREWASPSGCQVGLGRCKLDG